MRFRVTPSKDVSAEIKGFAKKELVELMRRAAVRMADGDADEHIERSVTWEGHSEEFSRWLVQEVRASFEAFGWSSQPRTTLELTARVASRLAMIMLLLLVGKVLIADRDSAEALIFLGPIVLLGFLYGIGFLIAVARLVNRLLGKEEHDPNE